MKWKQKREIIILLGYSEHVKISFHYALNAPCAYYAFLISKQQQPWIHKRGEFSAAPRETLFISWGKWKCQSEHEIYGASSCSFSVFGYDSPSISLYSIFFLPVTMTMGKGLKRFHDNNPTTCPMIYFCINVTINPETFLVKSRSMKILEVSRTDTQLGKVPRWESADDCNFAVCNLIVAPAQIVLNRRLII